MTDKCGALDSISGRYMIVGPTRSGTTALHLVLAGHPEISVFVGELSFPRLAAGLAQFSRKGHATDSEMRYGRIALFDAIAGCARTADTRVLGAKTTVNAPRQARHFVETVRRYLPGIKIIIAVRSDVVAHYGSRARLIETGVAHSWEQKGKADTAGMVTIDRWLLANSVLVNMENYQTLSSVSKYVECYEVNYEEFAKDNDLVYRRLLKYLGLDYVKPDWLTAKKLHLNPESYIKDYTNLVRFVDRLKVAYAEDSLSRHYVNAVKIYAKIRSAMSSRKSARKAR